MSPPLIEAEKVGRRASGRDEWLLRDASLALRSGERVALVGPSGSGKTLFLRSLALLDPLATGEIRWHGKRVSDQQVPKYRSRVIYLHQRPALVEGTVEENMRLPFRLRVYKGRAYNPAAVMQWLAELGRSASFLSKSFRELSGGEQQLVALLRVLQLEPEILLLDEPTAALDDATKGRAERLIGEWMNTANRDRAFVWVTHDEIQARRLCSRLVTLSAGHIVEESA